MMKTRLTHQDTIAEKARSDVATRMAEHVITTVKSDGLHRHWRVNKPGTWIDGFNIVTWPGYLCYCGDMGDYLFERTDDMVSFMRSASMSFFYAEEKCIASGNGTREWSPQLVKELLTDTISDRDDDDEGFDEFMRKIDMVRDALRSERGEDHVNSVMNDTGLFDGCDWPDCRALTSRFVYCLFAIKWFCDRVKDA